MKPQTVVNKIQSLVRNRFLRGLLSPKQYNGICEDLAQVYGDVGRKDSKVKLHADGDCPHCKGSGWVETQISGLEIFKAPCICITNQYEIKGAK